MASESSSNMACVQAKDDAISLGKSDVACCPYLPLLCTPSTARWSRAVWSADSWPLPPRTVASPRNAKALHLSTPPTAPATPSPCCSHSTSPVEPDRLDLGGAPLDCYADGCLTTTGSPHSKSCTPTPSPALQPSSSLLDVLHQDAGSPSSSASSASSVGAGRRTLEEAWRAKIVPSLKYTVSRRPCWNAACVACGMCKCGISGLQEGALSHDVVGVLEAAADWCFMGKRVLVTQQGQGDGIFHPDIEPALRAATLATMGPCHGIRFDRAWDPIKYRTDRSFWEPHAARDNCVDCKTKLM